MGHIMHCFIQVSLSKRTRSACPVQPKLLKQNIEFQVSLAAHLKSLAAHQCAAAHSLRFTGLYSPHLMLIILYSRLHSRTLNMSICADTCQLLHHPTVEVVTVLAQPLAFIHVLVFEFANPFAFFDN